MNPRQPRTTIIDTEEALAQLISRAITTDAVAVDTEFVWERTFYPRLGLIQIALSTDDCKLIDPVALTDLTPLGRLLACPDVIKIFHDARQDLSILARATGATPRSIFDTRLAAGFAGLAPTLSLASLVEELVEIRLDKGETRTNWRRRPLTDSQLRYAADDVRHLRTVRRRLLARITDPQVRGWLAAEMAQFDHPEHYDTFLPIDRSLKVKGRRHLPPQGKEVLRRLAAWREEVARRRDRPRRHILADPVLVAICTTLPVDRTQLRTQTAIPAKTLERDGDEILAHIKRWRQQGKPALREQRPPGKLTAEEKKMVQQLRNWIATRGEQCGVDPALVGNSSELKILAHTIVAGEKGDTLRQRQGWRREFLEDFFDRREP